VAKPWNIRLALPVTNGNVARRTHLRHHSTITELGACRLARREMCAAGGNPSKFKLLHMSQHALQYSEPMV